MLLNPEKQCRLSITYGWADYGEAGKTTPQQEALAYSPTRLAQVNNDFDNYPFSTVATNLRFHGSGKVMRLRYESVPGKDFVLEGYAIDGISKREGEADK